ncbi:HNH endonuclease [Escherichia coli]|nr:HNH endonuclease [Escherichia coli]
MGGSDELTNLELLHPNCHRQLHSRKPVLTESTYKGLSGVRGNSHAPFLGAAAQHAPLLPDPADRTTLQ